MLGMAGPKTVLAKFNGRASRPNVNRNCWLLCNCVHRQANTTLALNEGSL